MQHRNQIIIQKVVSELNIGLDMLGDSTLEDFSVAGMNRLYKRFGH